MVYRAWHWPKSLLLKGHKLFWFKLALFSLFGHLGLLIITFSYRSKENIELTVFSKIRPVEVVFVPLYKKAPNAQKKINAVAKLNKAKIKPKSALVKAKKTVKSVSKPALKSLPAASSKDLKSIVKQPVLKKVVAKKNVAKAKEAVKPKLDSVPTKLKLKEQAVVMKVPETHMPLAPAVIPKADSVVEETVLNDPIYIGRNDLKDLQMMHELEVVITKSWQPPVGFSPDTECTVELKIDNLGKVVSFVIKKSSNIAVYDMSVRRIFAQVVMPSSVYNKTLTIIFKQ